MAITNHERVGKALDLLKAGLAPFVERELKSQHRQQWLEIARASVGPTQEKLFASEERVRWDAASLLAVLWNQWNAVFRNTLGQSERTLVSELRDVRNKWAHQNAFNADDAYRALDSAERLLKAVSAEEAVEVERLRLDLLRMRADSESKTEKKKVAAAALESAAASGLPPWREVVTPHPDVAAGNYQQAEFAADLYLVHIGEGSAEYRDPVEFFRRTYLTESLGRLLAGAVERLEGRGGDPVVHLQTNFGGGKTHSMLALYHLFSGADASKLAGLDAIVAKAKGGKPARAKRVVLVGNRISPGSPSTKPDGTVVRTLWGELAWQLGGAKAFARVAADDEKGTSPGDALRELFKEYGPCLILIDEWVAYARQLHDHKDVLPAGTFETQFTFAQALTESAKAAGNCLVVVSLPASDTPGSPHIQADDIEVGGERGREALDRLRNVVGRLESAWRPATAEEGFEIVRRRLFQPLATDQYKSRDAVAAAFADLYKKESAEFPPECRKPDYERRLRDAYPIHPEVFDRLYSEWSTLPKFQRTRGVLRLMAAVIHSLWVRNDRSPLILPASIAVDDSRVQAELTHYLPDHWVPVIAKDVDGPSSLPLRMDGEIGNLGKYSAARRVARALFMGSAPSTNPAHRGLDDQRVKLGCVMPGEPPAVFGDALRRLQGSAMYLFHDGPRYWFDTQPTLASDAEMRAEQLKRNPDRVAGEIERRLKENAAQRGDFARVHALPESGHDVPDEHDARLVVLGLAHTYDKAPGNAAEKEAQKILDFRGSAPRLYRNSLVFLAADKTRLQDLDDAVRRFLAWKDIVEHHGENVTKAQLRQAEDQRDNCGKAVEAMLPETYQWLLVPEQGMKDAKVAWKAIPVKGQEALALRASKRLRTEELLFPLLGGTRLRMELDRVLWRGGNHVEIRQLADDFARYPYLPRLANASVLLHAIREGLALLTWEKETFAFAEGFDEAAGYRGLRGGQHVNLPDTQSPGLLVKPEAAKAQLAAAQPVTGGSRPDSAGNGEGVITPSGSTGGGTAVLAPPTRYHGSVTLDPTRLGRDASRIAEEVVSHLASLDGAEVRVTLEIEAEVPKGAPDNVVRTVTENSRTLKFTSHGFERE